MHRSCSSRERETTQIFEHEQFKVKIINCSRDGGMRSVRSNKTSKEYRNSSLKRQPPLLGWDGLREALRSRPTWEGHGPGSLAGRQATAAPHWRNLLEISSLGCCRKLWRHPLGGTEPWPQNCLGDAAQGSAGQWVLQGLHAEAVACTAGVPRSRK